MGTIIMKGDALFAPIYLPASGIAPSWAVDKSCPGRIWRRLNAFCLDEAREMGYEDSMGGRAERENPFHGKHQAVLEFKATCARKEEKLRARGKVLADRLRADFLRVGFGLMPIPRQTA
jgi:hypothetical protein